MVFAQKSLCGYFGFGMTEWSGLIFLCSGDVVPLLYRTSNQTNWEERQWGEMLFPKSLFPLAAAQGNTQHIANTSFGETVRVFCTQFSAVD